MRIATFALCVVKISTTILKRWAFARRRFLQVSVTACCYSRSRSSTGKKLWAFPLCYLALQDYNVRVVVDPLFTD